MASVCLSDDNSNMVDLIIMKFSGQVGNSSTIFEFKYEHNHSSSCGDMEVARFGSPRSISIYLIFFYLTCVFFVVFFCEVLSL